MVVEHRDVPGFPGYRIGNDGSILSCRAAKDGSTHKWKSLRLARSTPNAYYSVTLMRDGKLHCRRPHRLVLEAFVGPCPDGMEAAHLNGNKLHNSIENLCWKTHQENVDDKRIHGTHLYGEACPNTKLTDGQVKELRERYAFGGVTLQELANEYKVHRAHVGRIINGKKRPLSFPS